MNEKIVLLAVIFVFLSFAIQERVEVIYVTSKSCEPAKEIDAIIQKVNETFGNSISLKIYEIEKMPVKLRKMYKIYGAPTIIINREKLLKEYKEENIVEAICNKMIIQHERCR